MSVSTRIGLELLTRRVVSTAMRRLYVTFSQQIVLLMIYMMPDSFLNTEPQMFESPLKVIHVITVILVGTVCRTSY